MKQIPRLCQQFAVEALAIETGVIFPARNLHLFRGFSIAMLNNQMVRHFLNNTLIIL